MADWLIVISVKAQRLVLYRDNEALMDVAVSTALNGVGEQIGSGCTPRGRHTIRAKIGADCPVNTVFVARRPTGEIYDRRLAEQYPERDWILSRILWLSGLEQGKNRLGRCDTMRRYIYLHGTPDEVELGVANSHGCVRMRNSDIIKLFDLVPHGTQVNIIEGDIE